MSFTTNKAVNGKVARIPQSGAMSTLHTLFFLRNKLHHHFCKIWYLGLIFSQ